MPTTYQIVRPLHSCNRALRLQPPWARELLATCPDARAVSVDLVIPSSPDPPHPTMPLSIWTGVAPRPCLSTDLSPAGRDILISLLMASDSSDLTLPVTDYLKRHGRNPSALTATYFREVTIIGLRDVDALFEDESTPDPALVGTVYSRRPDTAHERIGAYQAWMQCVHYHDQIVSRETGLAITSSLSRHTSRP